MVTNGEKVLSIWEQNQYDRIKESIAGLKKALQEEGPHPVAHREIKRKHKEEWPTLWRFIEALERENL